jgi:DNA-binding transcriptional LysR family regulator
MLHLEDLGTFVEVADAGGVSPAARRLGVSKSIVSRRLVQLEAELGIQLLARTTREAALTEAGVTFRDHAARVCAEIDLARETILPAGDLRGRLRVAAPLSFGPTHLAPVLAQLARRHPRLHLYCSYTDRFVDIVARALTAQFAWVPSVTRMLPHGGSRPSVASSSPAPNISGSMALPKRLTSCSRTNVSRKARRPGSSLMETRRSPCTRKAVSKRTTESLLRRQPSPGSA